MCKIVRHIHLQTKKLHLQLRGICLDQFREDQELSDLEIDFHYLY